MRSGRQLGVRALAPMLFAAAPAGAPSGLQISPASAAAATAGGLTVVVKGAGSIRSSPSGLRCPSRCRRRSAHGRSITLSATPVVGSRFAGWRGACRGSAACRVRTGSAVRRVQAVFAAQRPSFVDTFDADRLDSYFFDRGSTADVEVQGGVLRRRTTTAANLCGPGGSRARPDVTVSYRFTTGGMVSYASQYPDIAIKRLSATERLSLDYQVSERRFQLFKIQDGAKAVLTTGGRGPLVGPNQTLWLRTATDRDDVLAEIFTADPNGPAPSAPAGRLRYRLRGGDADRFGSGVAGMACLAPHVYSAADISGWSVDDYRVFR